MLSRALSAVLPSFLLSFLLPLALGGCSGGSAASGKLVQPSCAQGAGGASQEALCLVSCNLGCTTAGCSINQIAQNQPLILVFNQDVDPSSVSTASISLRTASGEEPVGQFLTSGATVQFLPEIRTVGAQSFFGFRSAEVYQMTLLGGLSEINALRSTSGDAFISTYSCNLTVSRGVVDLDGEPPGAALVSPVIGSSVDPATSILIEFSEFISTASFVTSSVQNQPVVVRVSKTKNVGGTLICDPAFTPVQILGNWQIENDPIRQLSTAVFLPLQQVPSGVCVQIEVTNRVQDLSGKPAQGQLFDYFTTSGSVPTQAITDSFDNSINLDIEFSSGTWGNGIARPGEIGWDGLHGDFDPAQGGTEVSTKVFEWNTDDTTIPRSRTLSGVDERITDGVYRFSRFFVAKGVTVNFVGSKAARIYIRGHAIIEGKVVLNGVDLTEHDGNLLVGQTAGLGGSDGGAAGSAGGGRGADAGDGINNSSLFNGEDGQDVQPPAGHAYSAQAAGTRGRGSHQFPDSGLNSAVKLTQIVGFISAQIAAGGGGGGFAVAGQDGTVVSTHNGNPAEEAGTNGVGGAQFNLLLPPLPSTVFDHMAVGGAGGGGAGSHPFLSSAQLLRWHSGGAGAASGGALGLRIGGSLTTELTGEILAAGGGTSGSIFNNVGVPGGGGSGGSVMLQVGETVTLNGLIDVSGGVGGSTFGEPGFTPTESSGGDGSPGFIRLEVAGTPSVALLGNTLPNKATTPSITVAKLSERDSLVGSRSVWRFTNQIFPPDYLSYEVDATVDGKPMTYSDVPGGVLAGPGQALQLLVQGASVNAIGEVDPSTIRPWRRYVGPFAPPGQLSLTNDPALAMRFLFLFDRSISTNVTVENVKIVFQPF